MTTQYLSSSQLKRLKEHKYSADGTSICEPWMQVFWRWLVEQIPKTWAPNTITLVGLLLNVLTTLILIIYSPDGQQEVRKQQSHSQDVGKQMTGGLGQPVPAVRNILEVNLRLSKGLP